MAIKNAKDPSIKVNGAKSPEVKLDGLLNERKNPETPEQLAGRVNETLGKMSLEDTTETLNIIVKAQWDRSLNAEINAEKEHIRVKDAKQALGRTIGIA